MMHHEFEDLAGYKVSYETYTNIIEPMYLAIPENISKQQFIRMLDCKDFELKEERKPIIKKMLVRDRSGSSKTPNGCYYHIEWVDLIDVDIKTGKRVVAPLSDEQLAEIRKAGQSTDLAYSYDMDYTDCITPKHKPVELSWMF